MSVFKHIGAAAIAAAIGAGPALAAGPSVGVIDYDWSFEGPFGTYDQMQLQRGWQVYSEVCSGCHSLHFVSFRNLGDEGGPAFPEEQVEAIAAMFEASEMVEGQPSVRPADPNDPIEGLILSREEAEAIYGVWVPDLSVMAKARTGYSGMINVMINGGGGPEYLYSLLMGYPDEGDPEGWEVPVGVYFNEYYSGHQIAMPPQLWDGMLEYVTYDIGPDGEVVESPGPEATRSQMAADVTAFLMWAAEPHLNERKEAGVRNLILMGIFAVLLWYSNKKLWARIKKGETA